MSVEQRLREVLDDEARTFVPDGDRTLTTLVTRGRRRRTTHRLAAATLAVALAAGVGAGVVLRGGEDRAAPTVPAASPSPSPSPSLDPLARLAEDSRLSKALVGTWSTPVLDERVVLGELGRQGMATHRTVVFEEMPLPNRVGITFDDGRYTTTIGTEVSDLGSWHVKDGRLVLVPACSLCRVVLDPTLEGDRLRLTLLEDPSPDYLGIPDAVFAVAVYTSAPFDRTKP